MVLYSPMVWFGPVWFRMVLYGPMWPCMVPYGPVWFCMVLCGPVVGVGKTHKGRRNTQFLCRQEDVHIEMVPTLKTVPVRGRKNIPL